MGSRYGLVSGSLRGFDSLKIAPHFRDFFQTNSWQVHTSAFNGFGRLLMTDPRENVDLKPRCLNRYVWAGFEIKGSGGAKCSQIEPKCS